MRLAATGTMPLIDLLLERVTFRQELLITTFKLLQHSGKSGPKSIHGLICADNGLLRHKIG